MKIVHPKQSELREMFEYRDGNLINRYTRGTRAMKGTVAGHFASKIGYYCLFIKGKKYQTSRLVWIYHHGDIPDGMLIDHINRDTKDNRIENLRLATYTQNEWNKPKMGCRFEAGKWRARIKQHGKSIHLGMFDTKEAAQAAYREYAQTLHGEYQCK